jgi:PhzF family phenazine biosynthesis protein
MGLPLFVVDAFTSDPFGGNPAAVVLGHGPEAWMQALAAEMKHSETAFVRERPDGEFDLRWFTPEVEVDLCGHATLASAHVLFSTKRLPPGATAVFHTRGGVLRATESDARITLDFPIAVPQPERPNVELFEALGVEPSEFLRTDGDFFLLVVDDPATVVNAQPDFTRLRDVASVRGAYISAAGTGEYDIVSRCFAPAVGIDEDPVTGSMHCVLAAYWCERLGRDELRAYQASARGGDVRVVRAGDRVLLTGDAKTVLAGELDA